MHIPVLGREVLESLELCDHGLYLDTTFGGGGYAQTILEACSCSLWAIDKDPEAIERSQFLLRRYPQNFKILQGSFANIDLLFPEGQLFDGVVMDLGVSSFQFDTAERGFSFRLDGPLDMRMSKEGLSAADIVNTFSCQEISEILKLYGEEPNHEKIALAIVKARESKPIFMTSELRQIVHSVYRWRSKLDPSTLTFQALRVFVNQELKDLEIFLNKITNFLKQKSKLIIVTFQGLENIVVKNWIKSQEVRPKVKSLKPSRQEILTNPRSRSAKMWIISRG